MALPSDSVAVDFLPRQTMLRRMQFSPGRVYSEGFLHRCLRLMSEYFRIKVVFWAGEVQYTHGHQKQTTSLVRKLIEICESGTYPVVEIAESTIL